MKKTIQILLADGRLYSIDAHKVAHDKAAYYASKTNPDSTYEEEYKNTMEDDSEILEWLFSNMDWYELDPVLLSHHIEPNLAKCDIDSSKVVHNA